MNELKSSDVPLQFTFNLLGLKGIHEDKCIKGKGARIAIIDNGFYPHNALTDKRVKIAESYQIVKCKEGNVEIKPLKERFQPRGTSSHCHATTVAGIAVGQEVKNCKVYHDERPQSENYPGGIAPEAELTMFIIPIDDDCPKDTYNYLIRALNKIESLQKFDVVSISLRAHDQRRFELNEYSPEKVNDIESGQQEAGKIIQLLRNKGTHIVATSSNCGSTICDLEFPAKHGSVISIGSLTSDGGISKFSKKEKVDLYCYGEVGAPRCIDRMDDVFKKLLDNRNRHYFITDKDNKDLRRYISEGNDASRDKLLSELAQKRSPQLLQDVSGTSFAAPAVAALICLIMQHARNCDKEKKEGETISCENLLYNKQNLLKILKLQANGNCIVQAPIEFFNTNYSSLLPMLLD